jgi:hypothetical protein
MSLTPKAPKDLALAPVAASIDLNLQRIRDCSPEDIERTLEIELNNAPIADDRDERAHRILSLALRDVDLHGWDASITDDGAAVRLIGGSVSLDISLSAAVLSFIDARVPA